MTSDYCDKMIECKINVIFVFLNMLNIPVDDFETYCKRVYIMNLLKYQLLNVTD
jgi:hypothetical protein